MHFWTSTFKLLNQTQNGGALCAFPTDATWTKCVNYAPDVIAYYAIYWNKYSDHDHIPFRIFIQRVPDFFYSLWNKYKTVKSQCVKTIGYIAVASCSKCHNIIKASYFINDTECVHLKSM